MKKLLLFGENDIIILILIDICVWWKDENNKQKTRTKRIRAM